MRSYSPVNRYLRWLPDSRPETCRGCPQSTSDGFCRLRNHLMLDEGDVPAICKLEGREGGWPRATS